MRGLYGSPPQARLHISIQALSYIPYRPEVVGWSTPANHRPFGCRTHFCAVAGCPYPRNHVLDLIRRLEEIDQNLGGDGPHPLGKALQTGLAES